MKTKLARISKRSLATVLAFLMIFSTLMVGTISTAEAAGTMSTFPAGMTIYFSLNSSRWNNPSTVYAFFFTTTGWSNSSGTYTSVSSTKNSDGFFTAQVPNDGKTYKRVQFRSANNVSGGNYTNVHAPDYVWSNTIYDNNSGNWNDFTNWGSYNTTKSNTDGKLYFDNSKTNWTGNIYAVVARNTGSWYFRADKMTAVSNAPDIYYIDYPSTYSDGYTSIGFVSGSSVSSNSVGSTFYGSATNKTTFICGYAINNDSSTYVGEPVTSGSDVGYNLNYKSNTFNYFDQTYTLYSGAHGSAKIDGYQFTAHGTASANTQATASASNSTTMTIAKSSTVTVTPSPATGYQVKSVTLDSKTGTALTNAGNGKYTYKSDGSAHSIYVEFEPRSYTVTLNTNGGTINAGNVTSYTYGTGATLPTNVTKSNYTFDGWYDNSSLTGSAVTTISTTATGNKEYWAKWSGASYTVSYKDQGNATFSGTHGSGYPTSYTYGTGATLVSPTKTGYTFGGWYDNSSCTGTAVTSISTTATGNKTYYAKWTAKSYTITYKDQGNVAFSGSHASGYPTSHTYGTATTLKSASKTGYTFGGWFTTSACTGTAVTSLGATAYTANITLYAKWTQNNYTISSANGSGTTSDMYSFTGTTTAHYDGSPTFTLSANSGYAIDSITVKDDSDNDVDYTVSGTTYTITSMPASDVTVTVTARSDSSPAISLSYTGASGSATVGSGSVTTSTRHSITLTFTNQNLMPNGTSYTATYTFNGGASQSLKSGSTSTSGGNITLKSGTLDAGTYVYTLSCNGKTASVTVAVNQSRTLTVNKNNSDSAVTITSGSYTDEFGNSQSISSTGTYYCNSGTSYSVTYTATTNYCFSNSDNTVTTNTKSDTISSDTTIDHDTLYKKKYTITLKKSLDGAAATNVGSYTVNAVIGTDITAPTQANYTLQNYTVTAGTVIVNGTTYTTTGGSNTIPAGNLTAVKASANATIRANFTETTYTVSLAYGTGGGTNSTSSVTAGNVNAVSLPTVNAATGYQFSGWTATTNAGNVTLSNASTNGSATVKATGTATLTANFTKINYSVSKAATTNGSFTVSKDTANYGDQITITPTPTNSNYEVDTVKYNDGSDHIITYSSGYKFNMPANNVTVTVTFKEKEYTVTFDSGAHSSTANRTVTAKTVTGTAIPSNPTPSSGYTFSGWTLTSGTATISNSKVTATSTATFTAQYTETMHTVTVTAQTENSVALGTVSPASGSAGVDTGFSATATPKTGYAFTSWTGSNLTFSAASSASTTVKASANSTATANFKPTIYYLDISGSSDWKTESGRYAAYFFKSSDNSQNTWVSMTGVDGVSDIYQVNIPDGYDRVIFCRMNGGNNTNSWDNKWNQTVDISVDGNKNKYTIPNNNQSDGKYNGGSWDTSPYFPPATNTVTISSGTGGSVTYNTSTNIAAGGSAAVSVGSNAMSVVATPADGYTFNKWTASSGVTLGSSDTTASNTVTATADGTLAASFTAVSHNITKTESNATITITGGANSAATGDTVSFTVAPADYYTVGTVKYRIGTGSWTTLTAIGGTYSFTVPGDSNSANNIQISATGNEIKNTVTVTNDGHGTVNSSSKQIGAVTAVDLPTPTPNYGYKFAGWKVTSGTVYYNDTPYTNNAVFSTTASTSIKARAAATVQATFTYADNLNIYLVGRFRVYNSTHTTPTYVGGSAGTWSTTADNIPFSYDSTNHYYYVNTYSTLAEVSDTASGDPFFRVYDKTNSKNWQLGTDTTLTDADAGTKYTMALSGDKSFKFSSSSTNGPVTIYFDPLTNKLWYGIPSTHTATVGTITGSGTVTINGGSSANVSEGTNYSIVATPSEGYKLTSVSVGSTSVYSGNDTTAQTITHAMGSSNETVTATFTAIDYTVTAATAPSGISSGNTVSVNSGSSATVHYNDTVNVSVTVAEGYVLSSVKHGTTTVSMSGTTGTVTGSFNMPASNQTVTATFEAADPTVTTPSINSARYSALGNKYYTGDTYTTSATATNNTSITYKLVKGGVETTIDNPNSFTIGEAGTYTIKAIATNAPAGVTAKTANASTSSFTVLADSASTTKSITAYVDFHNNTVSSASVKINNSTSASLSRVGTSTVYSASVTVPYHYGPIAGSVNVALEDEFPAVITVDGNNYDVSIPNTNNKFINGTTSEVWIEAQGALGTTSAEPQKTAVTNSSSTKRIYVYKHSSYNDDSYYDMYLHYWGGSSETTWSTSSMPKMTYLTSYINSGSQTYYVYYTDVPADTTHVKAAGTSNGGTTLNTLPAFEKELGSGNALWLNSDSSCSTNLTTPPVISTYYNVSLQTGSSTSIVPEGSGTFTYSSGNTDKVTVAANGTITAVAAGTTTVTITATGERGDQVTATTNVTVSDTALTGSFSVMSYNHVESTFSVDDNNQVKINSVSTVLHGSKASGSSSTVRGGGIVTSTGSDYTKQFTVKYAAPETDRGYGGLAVRVTANYTANDDSSYFDGWYVGGTKSTVYTTEDDAIRVDGYNYVLKFIHENTINVTLNYNYRVWNTENGVVYDAAKADDEHTIAKVKTETVKLKAASVTDTDAKDMLVTNCPSIVNDYFNYKLVTKKKDLTADSSSDAYKYGFTVTTSGNNCTIEANLKRSAHKYTVTVNGYRYANTTYTYQKAIEIKAGEVMNAAGVYEFNNDTILNWYDGGQRMATGTSYKLRVTGDTTLTTTVGQSGDNNNGKAIISHKSHELKLDTSGIQKLTQNFYIADFINAELGGDEGEAEFVGGGVLYYAVNKTTGKATKAKITDNNGEADSDDLEDVINRVVDGNYTTDKDNVTDSTSNVVCRYKQYTAGSSIYKYSQSLQAYQYIFSQSMTNNSKYENYLYRVYAYFIYRVGDNYYISVSDNYADANLYEAE